MTNFVILAGRVIHEAIPSLLKIPHFTTEHITHSHYREMSSKSQMVSQMNAYNYT